MAEEKEEIYLLKRDKKESARYVIYLGSSCTNLENQTTDMVYIIYYRLDEQHAFVVDVTGGSPIHASIPKDGLFSVADIATGTGYVADLS